MLTTEQKSFFKFSFCAIALVSFVVGTVAVFTFIVSDRMLGFQHQTLRYHEELLDGQYDELKRPDVIVLGDSTATQNLIPTSFIGLKAISLASPGTSTVETYYRLLEYLEKNEKPRCVLLMTSYGAHQFHIDTLFWQLIVGHGLMNYEQVLDFYETSKKLNDWPGNAMSPLYLRARIFVERFEYYVQFGILNQAIFQPNLMFLHPQRSYRLIRRTHGAGPLTRRPVWIDIGFDGPNQKFLKSEFRQSRVLDHYLQQILKLTEKRGIKFYMDYGPIAASLRNDSSLAWLKSGMEYLESQLKPFGHAKSLMNNEWYVDTQFTDGTHLNWRAAMKYSEKVGKEISECSSSAGN